MYTVAKETDASGVVEVLGPQNAPRLFDDETLSGIKSFADAWDMAQSLGGTQSISDFGTGFVVVESKDQLIGVPLMILEWRFNPGEFGMFASATAVTEDGRKVIINDGSTGIRAQLEMVTAQRKTAGVAEDRLQTFLACPKGVRASRYEFADANDGKVKSATTYYLA